MNEANLSFPQKVIVTEQEIDISHITESQKELYRNLLEEAISIYKKSGREE